jgi:hypothetical protein
LVECLRGGFKSIVGTSEEDEIQMEFMDVLDVLLVKINLGFNEKPLVDDTTLWQ